MSARENLEEQLVGRMNDLDLIGEVGRQMAEEIASMTTDDVLAIPSPVLSDPIEVPMTDHDTTPIPTDVLRAWVERVNTHLGPFEDVTVALHRAAVAALGPPRRPVTRETPLGKEVAHAQAASEAHVIVGWDGDDALFRDELGAYFADDPDGWYEVDGPEPEGAINYDGPNPSVECAHPGCTNRLRKSDAAVPQFCSKEHRAVYTAPLPGTRVGERMTEHTPNRLWVALCDALIAINAEYPDDPPIIPPTAIDWIGDALVRAVVALPEESER